MSIKSLEGDLGNAPGRQRPMAQPPLGSPSPLRSTPALPASGSLAGATTSSDQPRRPRSG